MNQTQALDVITYLNRAGLLQALAGQAEVWADALEDVTVTDALRVARDLARERTSRDRWVTPGDILAGVKAIRGTRLANAGGALGRLELPPSMDPDDYMAEHAYRRTVRDLVANGADVNAAVRQVCEDLGIEPPPLVEVYPAIYGPKDQLPW